MRNNNNNATLAQIQRGWVDQPDSRGTFDIITTCVSGILICLWVMLYLNIPYPNEPWWRIIMRKLEFLGVAIVVPELVACMAGGQWAAASRSVTAMRATGNDAWTMTHGFFAEMGGFVLEDTQFPPFPVTTSQICYLVQNRYIDLPEITREDIEDKGKADEVVKSVCILPNRLGRPGNCSASGPGASPSLCLSLRPAPSLVAPYSRFISGSTSPWTSKTADEAPCQDKHCENLTSSGRYSQRAL